MREFSVPALYDVPRDANLTDLIHTNATEAPEAIVFGRKVDGRWRDVTAEQFLSEVIAVAKGLIASGVGVGDRVGVMSRTRYEWTLLDFAIWEAGAITVPIYETSSAEQIKWIASDAGLVGLVAETADNVACVTQARADAPTLQHVWQIDDDAIGKLVAAGAEVSDEVLTQRRTLAGPGSTATLIYTSGTTGRPKGCQLTHGNFLATLGNATEHLKRVFKSEGASTLLFMPLAHVFARVIEVGCVMTRTKLGHCPDVKQVMPELAEFEPTFILSVPRVFEKVYNGARQKAYSEGKGKIFDLAASTAIAFSEATESGQVGLGLKLRHGLFDRLVYAKLRAAMGGHTEFAISGGAPLGVRLVHFFRGIGLHVLEGYGLTETTAPTSVNPYPKVKPGTVGQPLPSTSARIADDGEILIKGPHVFVGYWHDDQATAEAFGDGWLHTGDVGSLDEDGYLRITGRKKEILVTAGGKNVAPTALEDRVNAHPLINQCMVVGDRKPFVAALVTLDPESLPHWKSTHGKPENLGLAELADDPEVIAEVQEAIDEANKAVSRAESIRKFRVLPAEWSVEGGQLTPSLKLKRRVVMAEHADDVEALYAG